MCCTRSTCVAYAAHVSHTQHMCCTRSGHCCSQTAPLTSSKLSWQSFQKPRFQEIVESTRHDHCVNTCSLQRSTGRVCGSSAMVVAIVLYEKCVFETQQNCPKHHFKRPKNRRSWRTVVMDEFYCTLKVRLQMDDCLP